MLARGARGLFVVLALVGGCQHRAQLDPRLDGDVVHLDVAPPSLSGGTLGLADHGALAIVADPDRDRVVVVDVPGRAVLRELALPLHSEPGRVIEDAAGRVHVALRGSGDLLTFVPRDAADQGARTPVCPMPRGVAYDASIDAVLVACRGASSWRCLPRADRRLGASASPPIFETSW